MQTISQEEKKVDCAVSESIMKYVLDTVNDNKTLVNVNSKIIRQVEGLVDQVIFFILRPERLSREELQILISGLTTTFSYDHFKLQRDSIEAIEFCLKEIAEFPSHLEEVVREIKQRKSLSVNQLYLSDLEFHSKVYARIADIFEQVGTIILPEIVRNYGKRRTLQMDL